ncbi:methylmalonyl-CoA epimerase, mitochondrial isoform X1 [Hippopotamus amphibius kiboko]|uniref:methylmalonyl-CoA epimerase, mitochondrial isoform X1 n=1 Tax=Hippopotamus amphibius kiboko TaxID=575201 RepID=UPI0025991190|nr:methylmalonyl-CoA epimerase, mitochondrial isoform X1 [Hippopotamus amphibius kiboko]
MPRVLKAAVACAAGLFPRLQTPVPTARMFSMSLSSHQVAGPVWNLGRLNHVAVAVPDLEKAKAFYKNVLGAQVGETVPLPEHGVSVVFVTLANTKMELLHPLGNDSPVAGFLQKNKAGGMHHICIELFPPPSGIRDSENRMGPQPPGEHSYYTPRIRRPPRIETLKHFGCTPGLTDGRKPISGGPVPPHPL